MIDDRSFDSAHSGSDIDGRILNGTIYLHAKWIDHEIMEFPI